MTEKEILEGNKLIAEFMESKFLQYPKWYNKSWDNLMPVVEKIEDINQIGFQAYIDISAFAIRGYSAEGFSFKRDGKRFQGKEKIEATWLAVVEFIKWHNKQKTK